MAKLNVVQHPEKGGMLHGLKNAVKAHPFLAGMAASYAVDALSTYFKNKKYTTKFFAKDLSERGFYRKMVEQLLRTGNYKLVKQGYGNGNTFEWELIRIR